MDWSCSDVLVMNTQENGVTCSLPWEARALWPWLMARCPSDGNFICRSELALGMARVTRLPEHIVAVGLNALADGGFVILTPEGLTIPAAVDAWRARTAEAVKKRGRRQPMSRALRFAVLRRDGFRCVYCGAEAGKVPLEVDHVVPVAAGGKSKRNNLVASCFDCNRGKRTSHVDPEAIPGLTGRG